MSTLEQYHALALRHCHALVEALIWLRDTDTTAYITLKPAHKLSIRPADISAYANDIGVWMGHPLSTDGRSASRTIHHPDGDLILPADTAEDSIPRLVAQDRIRIWRNVFRALSLPPRPHSWR